MTARAGLEALRRRYVAAQLNGDRREALRLVVQEGLAEGMDVRELQCGVVQAAQREIGRLWEENRITIAQEHMATAISQVVLSRLFEEAPAAQPLGRKIVVACVEGEQHDFPARIVADFLDLAGFSVRFLGANVPTDDLLELLEEESPDLLALSVTMTFNVTALRLAVERVRERWPALPILVGGHALDWEPRLAQHCGIHACAPDVDSVLESALRLTQRGTSPLQRGRTPLGESR